MCPFEHALEHAEPACFWLDRSERPETAPPLEGEVRTDLAIVGGGFTGLWAAVLAKEAEPGREVLLIEADAVAEHASGRNGGFLDSSITHGLDHGLDRFPDEIETLFALGKENYQQIFDTLERYGLEAGQKVRIVSGAEGVTIIPERPNRRFVQHGPILAIDTGAGTASMDDFDLDTLRERHLGKKSNEDRD